MKEVWGQRFDVKTMLLPWATGSLSNGNLSNSTHDLADFHGLSWHVTHIITNRY